MTITDEQKAEIAEAKLQTYETKRPTVPAMEQLLFEPIECLDDGFIRLIDYMGDQTSIVQAARVSYGKGTKSVSNDRGLLRYLYRNRHTSPFEMNEIKLHVKMPIFVARQWIRHRTANVNEISARYSILDKEFYTPSPENMAVQSKNNKQGRGRVLSPTQSARVLELLKHDATQCYDTYEELLKSIEEGGEFELARELARMNLPVNWYTQWYWKIDLHNLLHFLSLRMDPHAQYEIRVYAEVIGRIVEAWLPDVWEAFVDYRVNGAFISGKELEILRSLLKDEYTLARPTGVSKREHKKFCNLFGLTPVE